MPHRRRGRKIYTYRVKNRRVFSKNHPMRSAFGMILTLVMIVFAGIVGYSVVAPIAERLTAEAEQPTSVPDPFDPDALPTTTAPQDPDAETTATTTAATTAPVSGLHFKSPVTLGYLAAAEDLTDVEQLSQQAASLAAKGYNSMILPLKTAGGKLTYASSVEAAAVSQATDSSLPTLAQLRETCLAQHMGCMALFSTLDDQTYPLGFAEGAYLFAETGERWLDGSAENGGKPWISPFAEPARTYLADLAQEITDAGFQRVFCTDLIFPAFFDTDIACIGNELAEQSARSEALNAVLGSLSERAAGTVYTFDLQTAAAGKEETLLGKLAASQTVCVKMDPVGFETAFTLDGTVYDPAGLTDAEKTGLLLRAAERIAEQRTLYPCIKGSTLSDAALQEMLDVLYDAGYRTMLIE